MLSMNLKRTFHIIRRTLQIASKIKQYDAVDTKRITFQRVKVDDYYKVLSIRSPDDVYEGYDYLPDRFHKLISSSSIEGYAASIDNKLVAFQLVNLLDDGRTVLKQAGRVDKEYEGTGLYNALDSFTQQNYNLLGRQRTFSFDAHNQTLMKHLYARKMETVMSRDVTAYHVKSHREILKNNATGPNINNTIFPVHLKKVFKSEKTSSELFPEGRMLCFYVPYKLKDSNIPLIYSQGTKVLGSFTDGSLLVTAGTSFQCSKGHVFVLDVYGTLNNTFVKHLLQHFRHVDLRFFNEPMEINVHCMDSGNHYITDAMSQLDIQKDDCFRDVHHVATAEMN
ncbi:probable N-acetyltransferase 16 [Mytilus edulis]|uniref:probable N-acetyltransferase 16 n=1 Tax=Mytilus edulis TaxID=6550 RepID=UPI0039EE6699